MSIPVVPFLQQSALIFSSAYVSLGMKLEKQLLLHSSMFLIWQVCCIGLALFEDISGTTLSYDSCHYWMFRLAVSLACLLRLLTYIFMSWRLAKVIEALEGLGHEDIWDVVPELFGAHARQFLLSELWWAPFALSPLSLGLLLFFGCCITIKELRAPLPANWNGAL